MRAEIKMDPASKCGILQIIPENGTEAYALWSWWQRFDPSGGDSNHDSILTVKDLEVPPPV